MNIAHTESKETAINALASNKYEYVILVYDRQELNLPERQEFVILHIQGEGLTLSSDDGWSLSTVLEYLDYKIDDIEFLDGIDESETPKYLRDFFLEVEVRNNFS